MRFVECSLVRVFIEYANIDKSCNKDDVNNKVFCYKEYVNNGDICNKDDVVINNDNINGLFESRITI
jgi:hypothetical protein